MLILFFAALVFVTMDGLSLAVSGGCAPVVVCGLLTVGLLVLWRVGAGARGLQPLWLTELLHGLWVFLDQGSNLCPLLRQVDA